MAFSTGLRLLQSCAKSLSCFSGSLALLIGTPHRVFGRVDEERFAFGAGFSGGTGPVGVLAFRILVAGKKRLAALGAPNDNVAFTARRAADACGLLDILDRLARGVIGAGEKGHKASDFYRHGASAFFADFAFVFFFQFLHQFRGTLVFLLTPAVGGAGQGLE